MDFKGQYIKKYDPRALDDGVRTKQVERNGCVLVEKRLMRNRIYSSG